MTFHWDKTTRQIYYSQMVKTLIHIIIIHAEFDNDFNRANRRDITTSGK